MAGGGEGAGDGASGAAGRAEDDDVHDMLLNAMAVPRR
jgi:hypothetical protein